MHRVGSNGFTVKRKFHSMQIYIACSCHTTNDLGILAWQSRAGKPKFPTSSALVKNNNMATLGLMTMHSTLQKHVFNIYIYNIIYTHSLNTLHAQRSHHNSKQQVNYKHKISWLPQPYNNKLLSIKKHTNQLLTLSQQLLYLSGRGWTKGRSLSSTFKEVREEREERGRERERQTKIRGIWRAAAAAAKQQSTSNSSSSSGWEKLNTNPITPK